MAYEAASTPAPPRGNPDPALDAPVTPELVARHGLTPGEEARIRALLGREVNITELGVFSAMWSEHCSYKNSKPLLRGFPRERREPLPGGVGRVLVGAGEENAGIVDIGGGWAAAFKIESHNHPSAIEPFEGAATGVGGIIRDIFTMGARPVFLTNSLRFGRLDSPRVRRLFRGVVAGIAHYGNCIGVPTVAGDIYFDPSYEGNPLVNALCCGVLRQENIRRGRATGVGNSVFYVGAATGRDGLGGAAFSSRELTESSGEDRPAVQKGDPFLEKLLLEACLEALAVPGLVVGIQDMGAAGLTCAICETASRGRAGIEIELDRVPLREPGMNSYEILLSESQERMLLIVEKGREAELEAIFAKWDLHASLLGTVTDTGRMVVLHHGVTVVDLPAKILTDDALVYHHEVRAPARLATHQAWTPTGLPDLDGASLREALPRLLAEPTIASKRWVYRQYDYMVQAGTALLPGSDAAVVRVRTGDGERLLAISDDCNGRYCRLNPRRGGRIAVLECLRNLACAGARPLGMTDNLNFGRPGNPDSYYALAECVRGLAEACAFFDVPVTGGNVSLNNESPSGAIDPTPVVAILGVVADRAHITRSQVRSAGDVLVLLGGWPHELGASEFLAVCHGMQTGDAPLAEFEPARSLHEYILARIEAGHVRAAHDISEGGLLVCIAEMLFAPERSFGARLSLRSGAPRRDALLFGESQSRAVIAVARASLDAVLASARAAGVPADVLGAVEDSPTLTIEADGLDASWQVEDLREAWETSIERAMALPGLA